MLERLYSIRVDPTGGRGEGERTEQDSGVSRLLAKKKGNLNSLSLSLSLSPLVYRKRSQLWKGKVYVVKVYMYM